MECRAQSMYKGATISCRIGSCRIFNVYQFLYPTNSLSTRTFAGSHFFGIVRSVTSNEYDNDWIDIFAKVMVSAQTGKSLICDADMFYKCSVAHIFRDIHTYTRDTTPFTHIFIKSSEQSSTIC